MYEQFFDLTEKPFSIQPDPAFMFWGRNHRLAYAMLEYGVLNNAGISVITGGVGCGKTTLIHRLLDQLTDTHTIALLSNIQPDRGNLLSWVLMGFNQPFSNKSHVELFQQLQTFFISEYSKGRRCVLIIDEAQNLSSDMLEEIRMLSNINAGSDQLLQLILVGQPQLKEILNHPDMLQLTQRIGSDFHLTPLTPEEVHAYIDTRMRVAGAGRPIFSNEAKALVAKHSRGVPRVINVLADTALVYAFSAQEETISEATVATVVDDKKNFGVFGLPRIEDSGGAPVPAYEQHHASRKASAAGDTFTDESLPPDIEDLAAVGEVSDHQIPREAPYLKEVSNGAGGYKGDNTPGKTASETVNNAARAEDVPRAAPKSPPGARPDAPPDSPLSEPAREKSNGASAPTIRPEEAVNALFTAEERAASSEGDLQAAIGAPIPHPGSSAELPPEPPRADLPPLGFVILEKPGQGAPLETIKALGDHPVVFVTYSGDSAPGEAARAAGAIVVKMRGENETPPARSRNAGFRQLRKLADDLDYVQFLDGDAVLHPQWLRIASEIMARRPELAVLEGLIRDGEAKPGNGTPEVKEIRATGDSVLMRVKNFVELGGFRGDLMTADIQDFCLRTRGRGHHVGRVDVPMATSTQKKKSVAGWWRQHRQTGFNNAFSAALHGAPPERFKVAETRDAILWGFGIPVVTLMAAAAITGFTYYVVPIGIP
ncbi:MAG: AAA family ATPase, partial [Pseudomonadota bacterium]